jgi:hypothetical protein
LNIHPLLATKLLVSFFSQQLIDDRSGMAHDSNGYLIETLKQLVEAKKEVTTLREGFANLEETLTERNRLNTLKQNENDEVRRCDYCDISIV